MSKLRGYDAPGSSRLECKGERGTLTARLECATEYQDGYRVTVSWSEEDDAWIATLHECKSEKEPIGVGATKEEALCALACSLACLADALHEMIP